jgi:NhaP-type Na+/H+ and K+/H+ antiporters
MSLAYTSHTDMNDNYYIQNFDDHANRNRLMEGYNDYYDSSYNQTLQQSGNDNNETTWFDSEQGIDLYFVIFLTLLATAMVCAKFLHDNPRLSSVLPEAGMIIILGAAAGAFLFFLTPSLSLSSQAGQDFDYNFDDDDHANYNEGEASSNNASNNRHIQQFVAEGLLSFSPKIFFFILLPPIIFNSGYTLQREVFFRHIAPISLFACAGTAISAFAVAILLQIMHNFGFFEHDFHPKFTELMTFGALISATDPVSTLAVFQAKQVDPQLFYLVFGESVLNDAVGLVLFKTTSKLVGNEDNLEKVLGAILDFLLDFSIGFVGSMVMGLVAGLAIALFLKGVDMRHTPLLEVSLFFLVMYLPFFAAELMDLSGIVTILFTGISSRRYASHNLSEMTEETVDHLFRLVAHLAETAIFLELGLCVFPVCLKYRSHWKFALWAVVCCWVGRALNIYPLRTLYNRFLRKREHERHLQEAFDARLSESESYDYRGDIGHGNGGKGCISSDAMTLTHPARMDLKIRDNTAHMLWFAGLRGAVAYACAKTFPNAFGNRSVIVFTTMVIVLFTVFVFGCTTEIALNFFQIEMFVDEEKYMEDNETLVKMDFINAFGK